jgi:hypothetical protein
MSARYKLLLVAQFVGLERWRRKIGFGVLKGFVENC